MSGWKQAGLILPGLLAAVLAVAAAIVLLRDGLPQFGVMAATSIVLVAIYLAGAKWIERRVPTEFSLHHALPVVGGGALGGIALFSVVMAILWLAGVYRPVGLIFNRPDGGFAWWLATAIAFALAIAVGEEILFRGLLLRLCSKILGTWGALLLSAVVFGAAHVIGADAPFARASVIALTGGVLLGAAYTATGRLWLPIGLHWGWDFAEDSVFGDPRSGQQTHAGLIAGQLHGPDILTGASVGVDASIVTIILCLGAASYLLWRMVRLRSTDPPIWSAVKGPPVNAAGA